jgi:endonuclease/exonuclease/phosphatase family metal-dependent hydrolase
MSITRKILTTLGIVLAAVILVVGGYVLYIVIGYNRIPDHQALTVERVGAPTEQAGATEQTGATETPGETSDSSAKHLQVNEEYTALTFNIGFGAYDHDFSFFLDEGLMADGTSTVGSESRAASREAAERNTATIVSQALAEQPDILLFQEVDVQADRSWDVDQRAQILEALPAGTWYDYATNFHSGYLFYPPTKPIGKIVDAGLLTISAYEITVAERRSLPVSDAFPTKYFDLDRCISVSRLPVDGATGTSTASGTDAQAPELVLINVHPSAYDEGGIIRAQQMEMIADIMAEEYARGNYVIVGGDFNHAFGGSEQLFMGGMQRPEWVQAFDEQLLPANFHVVLADNYDSIGTCRDTSITYQPGVNYEVVIDGFIVSDNVEARAMNIDADYLGSDHNPVRLEFVLLG